MKKKHVAKMAIISGLLFISAYAQASLYVLPKGVYASTPYTLGPTTPGKWGDPVPGTPATVSWSLMGDGITCSWDCTGTVSSLAGFMPTGFETEIQRAFDAWENVAGITFVRVTDSGDDFDAAGAQGDIRIGGHSFDGSSGTLAHGFYPPANGVSAAGDIHFDTGETWDIGGSSGIDIFSVALHEIGHAIGLGHSTDPDAVMFPYYLSPYTGLDEDDINGAVALYGAPAPVPLPAAAWLMLSGLGILVGFARRKKGEAAPLAFTA